MGEGRVPDGGKVGGCVCKACQPAKLFASSRRKGRGERRKGRIKY